MSDYISRETAIEDLLKAADCDNCNAGAGGICGFCDPEPPEEGESDHG